MGAGHSPAPTAVLGPQQLQSVRPAPFTFTPTVTLFEEYNDNVFLDNTNRRADGITGAAPGFTLDLRGDTYRLAGGYDVVAETYARLTRLGGTFDRQNGGAREHVPSGQAGDPDARGHLRAMEMRSNSSGEQ